MEKTEGFYDFCIPYNKDEKLMNAMMEELLELGYKTVAVEEVFDHTKKETTKGPDIFPEPPNIQALQKKFQNRLRILQRITIIYADAVVTHAMNNSLNLRKYNLIAGQPKNDVALIHCCTTFAGDLICFNPESDKLMVNRKSYGLAIKRGIYFEIKYAQAIRDSNNRKDMIKIAHHYCSIGKSKSIIFSSGARNVFELRGPYDVANLSFIFGLSEDQGKNAVNRFCRQLFLKAESRRIGKTIMFVKALGPIVFSDSSESSDNENNSNMELEAENASCKSNDDGMSDSDEEAQPNKKMKTS